jgi:hypothetical protein
MRCRPSTPSNACSRTGSRRSSTNGGHTALTTLAAAAVLAACLAGVPAPADAQTLALGVTAAGGGARAHVVFSTGGADEPAATLRNGLESRITFTLRCYEHRPGLAGLFGDLLLAERTVVRVAFYDFFDRRFVVEQDDARASYADDAGFLAAFFTLRDVEISPPAGAPRSVGAGGGPSRYVSARAQYDPVRLSPPLTILTLFGVAARYTTPWVRRAVPSAVGAEALP